MNISKMRDSSSAGMPTPLSLTAIVTLSPLQATATFT